MTMILLVRFTNKYSTKRTTKSYIFTIKNGQEFCTKACTMYVFKCTHYSYNFNPGPISKWRQTLMYPKNTIYKHYRWLLFVDHGQIIPQHVRCTYIYILYTVEMFLWLKLKKTDMIQIDYFRFHTNAFRSKRSRVSASIRMENERLLFEIT